MASQDDSFYYGKFPDNFIFGSASSAYQCEGAWNLDGKGESIWDAFCHSNPSQIADKSTGDIACDSYHKYKEDVQILKNIGAQMYRFSVAWTRICPDGTGQLINQAGINYYKNLIAELKANGIEPMITLFHWDLPQKLQEQDGWLNEEITVPAFKEFANICFENFGNDVKYWVTFNEPYIFANLGYHRGVFAPGIKEPTESPYLCIHNMLKAHAEAYHLYNDKYRPIQKGKIGLTADSRWYEPVDPNSEEDRAASERCLQHNFGVVYHPILKGDYQPIFKEMMNNFAKAEGRSKSRLPEFSEYWIQRIKGTSDFVGLNHYTSRMATVLSQEEADKRAKNPNFEFDNNSSEFIDPSWPLGGIFWLAVYPQGLRKLLNWIKNEYGNPEVIITENGPCIRGGNTVDDDDRIDYYKSYMNEVLKAIAIDGCNVTGYMAWCIIDGFEWCEGYRIVFGLYKVDFNDPDRQRTPKKSAGFISKVFKERGFGFLKS